MDRSEIGCISYAYYRSKIDPVETPRALPTREEIAQLFISVPDPNLAEIIAIIRGSKQDPPERQHKHIVRHMIVVENGLANCSHRNSRKAPITYGDAMSLIADYEPDDRGISYLLYLCIRN